MAFIYTKIFKFSSINLLLVRMGDDKLFEAYQEFVRWISPDTFEVLQIVTVDISKSFRSLVVYPSGNVMENVTRKFDSSLSKERFCGLEHFKRDKGGKEGREKYLEIFGKVLLSHREKFAHLKAYRSSAKHVFRAHFNSFIEAGTIFVIDKNYLPWITATAIDGRYMHVEIVEELKYFKLFNTEDGPIIAVAEDAIQSNCEDSESESCDYKCEFPVDLLYKGFLISDNLANFCRRLLEDYNNIDSPDLRSLKDFANTLTRRR